MMRLAQGISHMVAFPHDLCKNIRGMNVWDASQLMTIPARDKEGKLINVSFEQSWFGLTIDERMMIFRLCSQVFGVVTSRLNRMAGIEWAVVPDRKDEERIAAQLKMYKSIYDEFEDITEPMSYLVMRAQIGNYIRSKLPDVRPDLKNFSSALLRYTKQLKFSKQDKAAEIEDWLSQPNQLDTWEDFVKKWSFDMLIHGSAAIFKEGIDRIENVYVMPGGTVMPSKTPYIGGYNAFIQYIPGIEAQVFFSDEVVYSTYIPNSLISYGIIPLDSLVNKIAETMLFDALMAEQADGTRPPDKMVAFGDYSPFLDFSGEFRAPMTKEEQERIELKLNKAKKHAIITLTGHGQPTVVDLSRKDTISTSMSRQTEIKKDIALAFNMSNVEINETGGEGTSGRATSESQERIERAKGIMPLILALQTKMNTEVIPYRYGHGYSFSMNAGLTPEEELSMWKNMKDSGLYSVNEIRTEEMNRLPFAGDEFDLPAGTPPQQPGAGMMGMSPEPGASTGGLF